MKKIVIIGAGSVTFTQGLVADFIRYSDNEKWELALCDINPIALDAIVCLCEKMVQTKNADIKISYSLDRKDLLVDADYVVTVIGVGGRRAWEQDAFIPRKYGINQPVGDTAMPGGISRAMRMIPVMIEIARDIEKLCPNARFFNYANPMTAICRALRKKKGINVVGLCHGVNHTEGMLARFAGLDRRTLTTRGVGINHLTFLFDIRSNGKDAKPLISKRLKELKKAGIDYTNVGEMFPEMGNEAPKITDPFAWEMFEKYDAFPAPGDRHITEFMAERFPRGEYYGKTLGFNAYTFEGVIELGDKIYEDIIRLGSSNAALPNDFFDKFSGEHEQLLEIIDSIENNRHRIYSANLPNEGAVLNLPQWAVLEMPSVAGSEGMIPISVGDFPDILASIITRHLSVIEVTVTAALDGDRRLFEEAILMGGYISDPAAVRKMTDELISAQRQYLPQF